VFRLLIKELNEKEVPPKFPALKFIFLSGELLYAKDIQEWRKLMGVDIEIVNLYGPTETTMIKTYHRITDVPSDPGQAIHVGQPISNTMVAILNNEKPCNVGEIGEIFIKTPFMSKGYYNQPDLTAEVFVQNPLVKDKTDIIYKTGDLGRFLNDNSIEILGRIDDQVKVNGIRIELNEIRKVILEVNGVTAVEILLTKNNDLNNELVCYYLGPTATEDDVRAGAQRNLIQGMVPSHFVRLEHFPLTHSGKVDRKILAMMRRLTPSDQQGDPPAGQTEELLAQIWKEVLAVERIGRSVSFFQIGGSSLRAIQVISRVYKTFGVRLIIGDIFNNPTLAKLAGKINEGRKEKIQSIISAPCAESYPLSHAQKRLWMLDQYEVNQIAFNINTSYALQGMLDLSAFKKAFELLIQRHESLRTIFVSVDGEPRQKIIPFVDVDLKVEVVDLVGREDKEQRLLLIQEQVFHFAFDLKCLPLFVIKLVKTQEHEHIFLLSIHHIIADGWSMNVFMDDLVVYYNTITLDRPHGLEPLKVQYKDYSTWHNSLLSESMSNNDKMFWQNLLKEFDTSVSLPTDFNRGTLQSFRGNRIFQDVGKEVTKRLKVFSSEQGVTLFHCLLAAVNCVVYGCYGMKDVVIGSPFAGRVLKELENQVGFYVNMLPLRIQLNPEASLLNFVKDVSQMVVKASEHELYPFDRIVSDFGGDTHLQRSSLFDLVVQLQDTQAISKMTDDPNQLTAIELPGKFLTSKFDLTFDFQESKDGIRIEIEYASDLFRLETIKSLSVSLLNVLRKIIDDPNLTLTDLKADLVQLNANPRVKAVEEYINSSLDESF
jgi:acyl carrier protein